MRQMESVLTSVVPAGTANWSDYLDKLNQEPDFVIEERPGNVFPTEASGETGESYAAETMGTTEAATDTEAASVDNQTQNHSTGSTDGAAGAVHARQFRWADGHSEPAVRHRGGSQQ